ASFRSKRPCMSWIAVVGAAVVMMRPLTRPSVKSSISRPSLQRPVEVLICWATQWGCQPAGDENRHGRNRRSFADRNDCGNAGTGAHRHGDGARGRRRCGKDFLGPGSLIGHGDDSVGGATRELRFRGHPQCDWKVSAEPDHVTLMRGFVGVASNPAVATEHLFDDPSLPCKREARALAGPFPEVRAAIRKRSPVTIAHTGRPIATPVAPSPKVMSTAYSKGLRGER